MITHIKNFLFTDFSNIFDYQLHIHLELNFKSFPILERQIYKNPKIAVIYIHFKNNNLKLSFKEWCEAYFIFEKSIFKKRPLLIRICIHDEILKNLYEISSFNLKFVEKIENRIQFLFKSKDLDKSIFLYTLSNEILKLNRRNIIQFIDGYFEWEKEKIKNSIRLQLDTPTLFPLIISKSKKKLSSLAKRIYILLEKIIHQSKSKNLKQKRTLYFYIQNQDIIDPFKKAISYLLYKFYKMDKKQIERKSSYSKNMSFFGKEQISFLKEYPNLNKKQLQFWMNIQQLQYIKIRNTLFTIQNVSLYKFFSKNILFFYKKSYAYEYKILKNQILKSYLGLLEKNIDISRITKQTIENSISLFQDIIHSKTYVGKVNHFKINNEYEGYIILELSKKNSMQLNVIFKNNFGIVPDIINQVIHLISSKKNHTEEDLKNILHLTQKKITSKKIQSDIKKILKYILKWLKIHISNPETSPYSKIYLTKKVNIKFLEFVVKKNLISKNESYINFLKSKNNFRFKEEKKEIIDKNIRKGKIYCINCHLLIDNLYRYCIRCGENVIYKNLYS